MKHVLLLFSFIMIEAIIADISRYMRYSNRALKDQGRTGNRKSCKTEAHGTTHSPCAFPCPWRNKMFDMYRFGNTTFEAKWTFFADGKTATLGIFNNTFQCFQSKGRFIVMKVPDFNAFFCVVVSYNPRDNPVKMFFHDGEVQIIPNKTDPFNDICDICGFADFKFVLVESGNPRPADKEFECTAPPQCTCCHNCTLCSVCYTEGNIPQECSIGHQPLQPSFRLPRRQPYQYPRRQSYRFPSRQSYRYSRRHSNQYPPRQYY
ncbi:Hypothetical predicted protein [Mytilus galloprovincialis]|uniref:Uncharacterized protein n=2 Tax=Mytilus galloprovincialis TaxID=29158 RepID=A0A8B6D858_MYTGA|nr:Hypothetical predicted protein [Mytilus galloprovincialis]